MLYLFDDCIIWILKNVNLLALNAYKLQSSLNEKVVDDGHGRHRVLKFGVKAKENQDKLPTLYW